MFGGPAAAQAYTYAGRRVGAEIANRGMASVVENTLRFAEGSALPMATIPTTLSGQAAAAGKEAYDRYKHEKSNSR